MSASKLRKGGPELLKWDVQPFIAHKRACLPKCALQEVGESSSVFPHSRGCGKICSNLIFMFSYKQLKNAILEGTHPSAASLKERSELKFATQCDTRTPNGDGDSAAVPPRVDKSSACDQVEAAKADLIPLSAENQNNPLPSDTTDRILLPYKRGQGDLAAKNLMRQSNANVDSVKFGGDPHLNAKRLKHDTFCSITSIDPNSVSWPENKLLNGSSQPSIDECDLAKESGQVDLDGSTTVSEDDHDKYVVSKRTDQTMDIEHEEFQHNQMHPFHSNEMHQNMPRDESYPDISVDETRDDVGDCAEPNKSMGAASDGSQQKTAVGEAKDHGKNWVEPTKSSGPSDESQEKTSVDETKDDGDHSSQPKASNDKLHHKAFVGEAKDGTQHCCEEEMLSDSTEYHDEEDVAREKKIFLSNQCTLDHDSLSIASWTEQNLCMKCNKDGQLLVCSSSGCPLVVHENCLGFPAGFDNMGNFYCPFCAFSRAVSEYLESKKKASLAKKELTSFINAGMKHGPGRLKKKHKKKQNKRLNESVNLVKVHENGHVKEKKHTQANHGDLEKQEAKSSAPCVTDSLLREEEATRIIGTLNDSTEEKQDTEETVKECLSRRGLDELQNHSRINDKHDGIKEQGLAKVGAQQEASQLQISVPPEDPASVLNIDAEGTSGDENDKPSSSTYHIRFRRQQQQ